MSLCPHGKNLKRMHCAQCTADKFADTRTCPHGRKRDLCSSCIQADSQLYAKMQAAMPKPRPASFAPSGLLNKKAKEEEPEYDIRDLGLPPATLNLVAKLIDIHAGITLEIKGKLRMKKQIAEQIKGICVRNDIVGKVFSGGVKLNYFKTIDRRITKESMLAAGYTPKDIAEVTQEKDKWNLRITPVGAEEEDEDYG